MARAKKEAALTPEERLQAALVPDWERPYKLPENWCWTRLGSVSTIVGGGTPSSGVAEYYENGTIPWISPADLSGYSDMYISHGAKNITELGLEKSSARLMPAGTVCLSSRAPIGYVVIAQNDISTNQGFKSMLPSPCFISEYLYWYLKGNKELLESYASGTTFLEISGGKTAQVEFPLAPLAEQQRIVDRIESLFSKLDEAKEKAQAVVDSFETRKAAILHKAFTGELTAKWREEHDVRMESWEQCSLSDVCTVNPKKADTKDLPDELEVSFFPMPALSEIYGEITDSQTRLLKEVRSGFTNFSEGDVVFAKITPCMENGKSAVIGKLVNDIGFGTTEFFVLRCSERLYNRFLYHLVRDKSFRDKAKAVMTGAVGQQRVPKRYLETYKLNLPKVNEQQEIVRILDKSFAREQQTKEAAEAVLDRIDLMKKSILARAFRGELGTNDPSEESAVELLKQII